MVTWLHTLALLELDWFKIDRHLEEFGNFSTSAWTKSTDLWNLLHLSNHLGNHCGRTSHLHLHFLELNSFLMMILKLKTLCTVYYRMC